MDALSDAIVAALPATRRFALGLTRSDADADDLLQVVCEKALSRRAQWDGTDNVKSWLFRIAQTSWIDMRRAGKVRLAYADNVAPLFSNGIHDGAAHAESVVSLTRVEDLIKDLPEQQRAAIVLVCIEGFSYQEAASVLGCPVGTLTSRLVRGRTELMARMAKKKTGKVVHRG